MRDFFNLLAGKTSALMGSYWAFLVAILIVLIWAMTGPVFKYSDTWQLIINTGTTIVTFLMVFLIQNTQNRDARAMHLKLDELIASVKSARNEMIDIEHLSDEELERIAARYKNMREALVGDVQGIAAEKAREVAQGTAKETARETAKTTARKVVENDRRIA
ncbi:MAG TPA: low affinity iron permease family protein [Blastocatellia bacterium]|jgi:low affinity Fe/Cu permease|nr:low affinity iron permease family protein [Blastocatellia bacterium]